MTSPEEILELVKNGTIEPADVDEFEQLDDWLQDMVANGDMEMEDAKNF